MLLLLTACNQELQADVKIPAVTSVFPTNTPLALQTTPIPATPTEIFSSAQALVSGPIHIVTVGDDFTHGDGDKSGAGYPSRLLEIVSQIRPVSTLANLGQSGWTSNDLIKGKGVLSSQLSQALGEVKSAAAQRQATLVLVWIGGNDLWELYTGTNKVTAADETQDALRFSQNIDTILSKLEKAGAQIIIAKLDDQSKQPARTRGQTYPDISASELLQMSAQVQRYNEVIAARADEYGALTVDFSNTDIFTNPATLAGDGFHPNPAGYDLIAQAWYKSVIKILP